MKNLIRLPEVKVVTGEVVECKLIDANRYEEVSKSYYAIKVQETNGKVHSVNISKNKYDGFDYDYIIYVGNVITIELLYCVADETEYIDDNGDPQPHTEDHIEAGVVIHASRITMTSVGIPYDLVKDIMDTRKQVVALLVELHTYLPDAKFHAKRSDEYTEQRITNLIKRWNAAKGMIKESIGEILEGQGYTLDGDAWNKVSE
jgi:hypothetical protein